MTRDNRQSGVVLVLTLWAIVLLSALGMAASTTFRGFAGVIGVSQDKVKAEALLDAGLEAAASIVGRLDDKQPLAAQDFDVGLATGTVHIKLSDENGRIDINKAPVKVLSSLLQYAGAEDANAIANSIDAWRRRDQPGAAANPPGNATATPAPAPAAGTGAKGPDNPPSFNDVRQLAQTPGMTADMLAAIAPLITVFGDAKVNALTASPEVLAALPGMRSAQIDALLEARLHLPLRDGQLQPILGSAGDNFKSSGWPVAAVELVAQLPDGYREAARATIVVLPNDRLSYRVLAWTPSPLLSSRRVALGGGS